MIQGRVEREEKQLQEQIKANLQLKIAKSKLLELENLTIDELKKELS